MISAPDIWLVEAGNALWRRSLKGEFDSREAANLLGQLQASPVRKIPSGDLLPEALALSLELRHPIYDCLYLACAIALGTTLITADQRLLRVLSASRHTGRATALLS